MRYRNLRAALLPEPNPTTTNVVECPEEVALFGLGISPKAYLTALLALPSQKREARNAVLRLAADGVSAVWPFGYLTRQGEILFADVMLSDDVTPEVLLLHQVTFRWMAYEMSMKVGRISYHGQFIPPVDHPATGPDEYETGRAVAHEFIPDGVFDAELELLAEHGPCIGLKHKYVRHVVVPLWNYCQAVEDRERRWLDRANEAASACSAHDLALWMREHARRQ